MARPWFGELRRLVLNDGLALCRRSLVLVATVYCMPPLAINCWPVSRPASSVAKNAATKAMS